MQRRTGNVVKMRYAFTAEDAQKRVREIAWESKQVIWTDHALERMQERGFTLPEVLTSLRGGYVDEPPTEEAYREWKCKVTKNFRGRTVGVITVVLDQQGQLVIVTVEWEDIR
jgi:Domain of unknown function (DUF4258)